MMDYVNIAGTTYGIDNGKLVALEPTQPRYGVTEVEPEDFEAWLLEVYTIAVQG